MTMTYRDIIVHRRGPALWITLNRPDQANAISQRLAEEFDAAVRQAERDEGIRVLVLRGSGRFFCAGGDVAMMHAAVDPPAFLHRLASTMHQALLRLAGSRLVTIAAVDGVAAGAGLGLVLNADIVVATERAGFLSAYSAIGLSPDCGVSYLLPRVIGPRRATQMAVLGTKLDARRAVDWGLVTELVDAAGLAARLDELVALLGAGPAPMLGATKRLLATGRLEQYAAHLEEEADTISALLGLEEVREQVARFATRSIATATRS